MNEFFSEREKGKKELTSEEITVSVFNGIVGIYKKYQKNFSFDYPDYCPDYGDGTICGVDVSLLNSAITSYIPKMGTPVQLKYGYDNFDIIDEIEKYALLDFIEFCYSKIADINETDYHTWFKHFHIFFPSTELEKENFRNEVNRVFERNGIVFYLDNDGMITRHLPIDMNNLLENLIVKSTDDRLNELINLAIYNIRKPKENNRNIALEKIWDAFERMKTVYFPENKKQSANTLIANVAGQTNNFEGVLVDEFNALTKIGNDYQIRHFETNKIQITSMKQVDYLFYRMIALIDLCLDDLNKK